MINIQPNTEIHIIHFKHFQTFNICIIQCHNMYQQNYVVQDKQLSYLLITENLSFQKQFITELQFAQKQLVLVSMTLQKFYCQIFLVILMNGTQPLRTVSQKQYIQKFVIKPRRSIKECKTQANSDAVISSNQDDIHQFISYMIKKSKKLRNIMQQNNIEDPQQFALSHLLNSQSLMTTLKIILDRLFLQRRLGKNLKGMNKYIFQQIETKLSQCIDRQFALYKIKCQYQQEKKILKNQIEANRKQLNQQHQKITKML